MKRSEINALIRDASKCFQEHGWTLPPSPKWDVTDFGLGDWRKHGLVLVNLAEEPEYCEKLMYARERMQTPAHTHNRKKEDIVVRWGRLKLQVWAGPPEISNGRSCQLKINGQVHTFDSGAEIVLQAGERITLTPGIYHRFEPVSEQCIIGEVSTANDDLNDNVFGDERVGRFASIEEDEPAIVPLLGE